ncbi:MAG TPA: NADPH-dependent F420 reductase [Longimicrobiaceae bacterium]|jgi:hypothetical protein
MRVTIIGPGDMGRGIATRLLAGGHDVTLVGRDRGRAEAVAAELASGAEGGASIAAASGPGEAIPGSEVVVLALPYAASLAMAREVAPLLGGRVVVDISNPLNDSFDGLVTAGDTSAAETIRAELPADARVVKAFNTTFAGTLARGEVAGQTLDVFIAGDDEPANHVVVELVRTGGMRPIEVGGLHRARQLEAMGLLGITLQGPLGTGFGTGWKLVVPGTAPSESGGFPRNAVAGVFDDQHAAGGVAGALREAGADPERVLVLYGSDGRERIERAREGSSSPLDFLMGYEVEHTRRHLRELDAGRAVVLVEADDDAFAERAGAIMAEHGGRFVNYYSRWTSRSIVP